jgi:hypothetical protein
MKRLAGVLTGAILLVVTFAGAALAQSYPGTPSETTSVSGAGGNNGGTAFTGGNVSRPLIALVVLVVVGLAAMFVARRRATNGAS